MMWDMGYGIWNPVRSGMWDLESCDMADPMRAVACSQRPLFVFGCVLNSAFGTFDKGRRAP